jgi:adenylate cyclase
MHETAGQLETAPGDPKPRLGQAFHPLREQGLPDRVREAIQEQSDRTERLIGWVQLLVVVTFALLYGLSRKTFPEDVPFEPVPWFIGAYSVFTLLRLGLAYRMRLPGWFLVLSIIIDMALLFGLIWSFHIQYMQPPSFYLKAPTMLYVFIFIALRALRFEARFVLLAGFFAALGWLVLVFYVIRGDPEDSMITRDYVGYLTSNSVLLGAEFDKIASILVVTAILGVAILRGRALLVRSVSESVAAQELSRFFAPEVAARIRQAHQEIAVGSGEVREAAVVNFDMRGFTRLAQELPPNDAMKLLAEYQHVIVPVIQGEGGSIDKFLGDGIMATFGASQASTTFAADALRAIEKSFEALDSWRAERTANGLPCPQVGAALASGPVIFGAVGDESRLEYTVIGDAVNLSAKLEKGNKVLGVSALSDARAFELALSQGFEPLHPYRRLSGVNLEGVGKDLDLFVLRD